jgi:hypothetical protein
MFKNLNTTDPGVGSFPSRRAWLQPFCYPIFSQKIIDNLRMFKNLNMQGVLIPKRLAIHCTRHSEKQKWQECSSQVIDSGEGEELLGIIAVFRN